MPRAARRSHTAALAFDAITVEGSLIAPAMLARIAERQAGEQADADYRISKGLTLRDEIARYFRIGQALFAELSASSTPSVAATIRFVEALLRDVFGFSEIGSVSPGTAITLAAHGGRVPVVVVPPADDLDVPSSHLPGDGRRRSAASALRDRLNADDTGIWGLCSNGMRLRLLRENKSLTRPAFIEADLSGIFGRDAFAEFAALWLLVHASRFGAAGAAAGDCPLERWREAGAKAGVAARERLRDGVEEALKSLGNGFLAHPGNAALCERLASGALPLADYFGQLLRLVYRLIFLLAAEDRGLLHPPAAPPAARRLYADGYSVGALRNHAVRRTAWDRHHDRWEGLLIVFAALARGEPRLGLPALGGLFDRDTIPDLDKARLANRGLMEAVYRLAWLREEAGLAPVNWRDMQTEELGSVYESLLELTPRLAADGHGFGFAEAGEARGHARKTTGSYYTPDSLVQVLLDSALDPVLDRIEAEADDPATALLSVTVVDPACGSGHFLLAAARRIATRIARHRTQGVASAEDYRHALREVVRASIHGVDKNPLAVELTKVALWIETVEPGKPLGFLDANIRCGDSLLGVFDLDALRHGIPDAAYRPLTGDDKEAARYFDRRNKDERAGQGSFDFAKGGGRVPAAATLAAAARSLRAMPEDSPEEIAAKRRRFTAGRTDPRLWSLEIAAQLYIAAFLLPKTGGVPANRNTVAVPTSAHVWEALAGHQVYGPLQARALEVAGAAHTFHWPLEFPDVMLAGGFDAVLGNPPWERIKLQEQEFFAARDPEIAEAPNAAARGKLIAKLKGAEPGSRDRALHEEFETAKRTAEAASAFARVPKEDYGRFPLTGRGDVNTYALFAELFAGIARPNGRAGVILPTGIATDATTAPFFAALIGKRRIVRLTSFENEEFIFPGIHHSFRFCLTTFGRERGEVDPVFSFFLRRVDQLPEAERSFTLSQEDIVRINPNTKTAPIFRSRADAELTKRIYERVPVLIDRGKASTGNPWGIAVRQGLFHLTNDIRDGLVLDSSVSETDPKFSVPLTEGKMFHQFDHRWSTYARDLCETRELTDPEKADPSTGLEYRYWTTKNEFRTRISNWNRGWLLVWRDITSAHVLRTVIAAIVPCTGVAYTARVVTALSQGPELAICLLANLNSIVLDFVARQFLSGTHLSDYVMEQLSILPPCRYRQDELEFVVPRALELSYTSISLRPLAEDLGYDGPPFAWDEDRRALLRAELDAWYARAYGLSRDELRYILDPADVKGPDYPSETFRVLKKNETARFGEYRTARLVLAAWDAQETRRAAAQ